MVNKKELLKEMGFEKEKKKKREDKVKSFLTESRTKFES